MSGEEGAAPYAAALAELPGAGPVGLRRLLEAAGDPRAAWREVLDGRFERPVPRSRPSAPAPRVTWAAAARGYDVAAGWRRLLAASISVTWLGDGAFPDALRSDPCPPAVLFWTGGLDALRGPCVALVGTRRATGVGRDIAFELGHDLAAAGVCVVSGLALGIDGAAHRGALATGRPRATVGVAASGVDRVYPRRHAELWEAVAGNGAVVSETPPGRGADAWRFPARNRIIAGLVSMVVVVESHASGGSLITADAAIERGIEVRAVPGPIRSPASAGSNQLLFDGPGLVRDAADILEGLELAGARHPLRARCRPAQDPPPSSLSSSSPASSVPPPAPQPVTPRPAPPAPGRQQPEDPFQRSVLDAVGWSPTSLNRVVDTSGRALAEVAVALDALLDAGLVMVEGDWWQRRR